MWCLPPEADAEFVCAMENEMEVYKRPYDPGHPVVCLDEKSKQLVAESRVPIPARAGQSVRCDYEYVRYGTANLFMMVQPLRGWRHGNVTTRRTKTDLARQVKELVDVHFPQAQRITLVMDNLNAHRLSSLYEAFAPAAVPADSTVLKHWSDPHIKKSAPLGKRGTADSGLPKSSNCGCCRHSGRWSGSSS